MIKISKEFDWEMSHRLPFHDGLCRNLHGHSYKLRVIVEGKADNNSMVIDYYEVGKIFRPIIEMLDHSFLCDSADELMISFLQSNGFKCVVMEKHSTAENITEFVLDKVIDEFRKYKNIDKVTLRIYETHDAYAESTVVL